MKLREELDGEISKTQAIRLLDIFGIGPLMIYAGVKTKEELPGWARAGLVLSGVATIGYNGMNYIEQEKLKEGRIRRAEDVLEEYIAEEEAEAEEP